MESRCVALFAAVAIEKNPQRRFKLLMQRDDLRLELLRIRSNAAKDAGRRNKPFVSPTSANAPCCGSERHKTSHAKTTCEMPWYCRVLSSDDPKSIELPIDVFARNCSASADKHHFDRADLFADALANFAEDVRDYSALASTEKARIDKRWNRALSKAVHGLYARDFVEHHSREREKLGDAYQKWTPRFTRELAIVLSL